MTTRIIDGKEYMLLPSGTELRKGDKGIMTTGRPFIAEDGYAQVGMRDAKEGYWRPLEESELDKKIKVLQAARGGEKIQRKNRYNPLPYWAEHWMSRPCWTDVEDDVEEPTSFNFGVYEYRVKPREHRITKLMRDFHVAAEHAKVLAEIIKNNISRDTNVIIRGYGLEIHPCSRRNATVVTYGCEQFTWEEIDTFAKEQRWW